MFENSIGKLLALSCKIYVYLILATQNDKHFYTVKVLVWMNWSMIGICEENNKFRS